MMFNEYPYRNLTDLNLDYILNQMKVLVNEVTNFVSLNAIKYADPIQWDITTQYAKNTVVIEPNSGTAYLSVQAVPSGMLLTNTDYWTPIFTLNIFGINQNITFRDDGSNLLATFTSVEGDWLIWNNELYKVTQSIGIGTQYVVGFNLERFSVELYIKEYISNVLNIINNLIGDLDDLNTTDKTNLVAAINEVLSTLTNVVGDLDDLNTTDKTNLVAAINEVLSTLTNVVGDLDDLTTTDKSNLVNAINEVVSTLNNIGNLNDLNTTDKSSIVAAINETVHNTGDLNDLDATDKSSIVAAINETIDNIGDLSTLNILDNSSIVAALNNIVKGSLATPEMYGAAGDGVANDTAACQQCLNENPISYFENDYLVDELTIPQGHVLLGGSMDTAGIICRTGSVKPMASATIMNIRLHSYSRYLNNVAAIRVVKPFVNIVNVNVIDCAQALFIRDDNGVLVSGLKVTNLHVEHCTSSIIYITNANDLYFENCILNSSLDGVTQSTTSDGIQMYGFVQAVNFVNCAILQSRYGFYSNNPSISGASDQVAMIKFTNCWFDSCVQGVRAQWVRNVAFSNCWFAGRDALNPGSGDGARFIHSEAIQFTGCLFDSCNNNGLALITDTDNVVVSGCIFQNIPQGIYVDVDCHRIIINGNFFGNSETKDLAITMTTWLQVATNTGGIIATNNATSGLALINNSGSSFNVITNNSAMPAD